MAVVTMKALLESGVHFGHRTHRWHPLMKPFIFTERNGIHIVNLQLTVKALTEAYNLVRDTVAEGGTVLFVGTKRQAQETIEMESTRAGMPYVTARWLGGMLTNFRTIRERINELDRLERQRDAGEFDHLTKKEALMLSRKIEKLATRFAGTRKMVGLPDLLFVVDVRREETAVHEANLLEIPIIAMVDTNCDPRDIDFIIPSNDDAIRAIKLIVGKMADAVLEGKALRKDEEQEPAFARPGALGREEAELADEDLLGEATLAKLREIDRDEEAAVEVEEEQEEAEAPEEPVEPAETADEPPAAAGDGAEDEEEEPAAVVAEDDADVEDEADDDDLEDEDDEDDDFEDEDEGDEEEDEEEDVDEDED
jgi:small subunit ribosomal protein S2